MADIDEFGGSCDDTWTSTDAVLRTDGCSILVEAAVVSSVGVSLLLSSLLPSILSIPSSSSSLVLFELRAGRRSSTGSSLPALRNPDMMSAHNHEGTASHQTNRDG